MAAEPDEFRAFPFKPVPLGLSIAQLQRRAFELARDIARTEDEIRLGHRRLVKDSSGHTYRYDEKSGKLLASYPLSP